VGLPRVFPAIHRTQADSQLLLSERRADAVKRQTSGLVLYSRNPNFCSEAITFIGSAGWHMFDLFKRKARFARCS